MDCELHITAQEANLLLDCAARYDIPSAVSVAVQRGANGESGRWGQLKPLHVAAKLGFSSTVSELIRNDLPVNSVTSSSLWPPLLFAVQAHFPDTVKTLINAGADVNLAGKYNYSALHCACDVKDVEMIAILLNAGADMTLRTSQGETARDIAVRQGLGEVFDIAAREIRLKKGKPDRGRSGPSRHER